MHLTSEKISQTEKITRLNMINSVSGIKPANLIGTVSGQNISNLAIFSSVIHLGSNPALLGFILRPQGEQSGHTFENILETGYYTINQINTSISAQAHYTSAKFEKNESEFDKCGLTEEYLHDFRAPYVKESLLKIGMKYLERIPIEVNGTSLIIGEIQHLIVPNKAVNEEGLIDYNVLNAVGIVGLNAYYKVEKVADYPYARPSLLPEYLK